MSSEGTVQNHSKYNRTLSEASYQNVPLEIIPESFSIDDEDESESSGAVEVDGLLGVIGVRNKNKFNISSSLNQQFQFAIKSLIQTNSICCIKFQVYSTLPCLHFLAKTGDIANLKLTLACGTITEEIISYGDQFSKTALHYAAGFKGDDSDAKECVQLLINAMKERWKKRDLNERQQDQLLYRFVNPTDNSHETPLYLATKERHLNTCYLLLRSMADWDIKNKRGKSPVMKLFKKLPELFEILVRDRTHDFVQYTNAERTTLAIDFALLIGHPTEDEIKSKNTSIYEEMNFISNVIYTPLHLREKILNHTFVKIFIWLKWRNICKYFWIARTFQVLWFILYFLYLVIVYRRDCPYPTKIQYNFTWFNFYPRIPNNNVVDNLIDDYGYEIHSENSVSHEPCTISTFGLISSWILLTTAFCDGLIFELLPMTVRLRRYWYPMKYKSIKKYAQRVIIIWKIVHPLKWIFLTTIFLNMLPVIIHSQVLLNELQYVMAALGVALTWHQILLQIGKIISLKVYIKMLLKILVNLSLVLLLYASLIIGFAAVFCILLPGVPSFSLLFEAVFKISTFFIGEIDYEETFYTDGRSAYISASFGASILFYGIAIVILHIALLNFLIGLTITNIQDIAKYSDIWANYSCVWQIFLIETFLAQPFPCFNIFSRLKLRILKSLMLINYKEYKKLNYKERCFVQEIRLADLPKTLRHEIRALKLYVVGQKS